MARHWTLMSLLLIAMVLLSSLLETADGGRKKGGGRKRGRRNKRGHDDCLDSLAEYKLTFHGAWSKEKFPRMYPRVRPPAQWSKLVGRSHNDKYHLFKEGEMADVALKSFAEDGDTLLYDAQPQGYHGLLDTFNCDPITTGEGKSSSFFVTDGAHTKLSFVVKLVPSPDWFVGVDGVELCRHGRWRSKVTVNLRPLDAGTDRGYTFTSPNWPSYPRETVYEITSSYPDHPASAFLYPEYPKLPRIAYATMQRVVNYVRKGPVSPLKPDLGSHLVVIGGPEKTTTTASPNTTTTTLPTAEVQNPAKSSHAKVTIDSEEDAHTKEGDSNDEDDTVNVGAAELTTGPKSTKRVDPTPLMSSPLQQELPEESRPTLTAAHPLTSSTSRADDIIPTKEIRLQSTQSAKREEKAQRDYDMRGHHRAEEKAIEQTQNYQTLKPADPEQSIAADSPDSSGRDPLRKEEHPLRVEETKVASKSATPDNGKDFSDLAQLDMNISPSQPSADKQNATLKTTAEAAVPHGATASGPKSSVSFGTAETLTPTRRGFVESSSPLHQEPSTSYTALRTSASSQNDHLADARSPTAGTHFITSPLSRAPTASTSSSSTTNTDRASSTAAKNLESTKSTMSRPTPRILRPSTRASSEFSHSLRTGSDAAQEDDQDTEYRHGGRNQDSERDSSDLSNPGLQINPRTRTDASLSKSRFSLFGQRNSDATHSAGNHKEVPDHSQTRTRDHGTRFPVPRPTPDRRTAEPSSSSEPTSSQSQESFNTPQFPQVFPSRSYDTSQPEDCQVTEWTTWSECSKSCGFGVRIRTRDVTSHSRNGGYACPVLEEEALCGSMRSCRWQHFSFLSKKPEEVSRKRRHHHNYHDDHSSSRRYSVMPRDRPRYFK